MEAANEYGFRFLVANFPSTIPAFCANSQAFEEARHSRHGGAVYHRLRYVAVSFAFVTAVHPDIRALIRELVRDKLRAVLPNYFHPLYDTDPPEASLVATIRDSVRSVLSGTRHLPTAEPRNRQLTRTASTSFTSSRQSNQNTVTPYSEEERRHRRRSPTLPHRRDGPSPSNGLSDTFSPGRPMTTRQADVWHSNDSHPICFHFSLPDLVYRYCHRRLCDLSLPRCRYDSYNDGFGRPASPERASRFRQAISSRNQHTSRSASHVRRRRPRTPFPRHHTPVAKSQEN